jgi:hypothetical protein
MPATASRPPVRMRLRRADICGEFKGLQPDDMSFYIAGDPGSRARPFYKLPVPGVRAARRGPRRARVWRVGVVEVGVKKTTPP